MSGEDIVMMRLGGESVWSNASSTLNAAGDGGNALIAQK